VITTPGTKTPKPIAGRSILISKGKSGISEQVSSDEVVNGVPCDSVRVQEHKDGKIDITMQDAFVARGNPGCRVMVSRSRDGECVVVGCEGSSTLFFFVDGGVTMYTCS
jgi:hypothetical protein